MIGIYKFTNKKNGKIYIGQTGNISRRFYEHLRGKNQQIDQAIKKYGIQNFDFTVIEECPIENLNIRESYWIDHYNSTIPNGYNIKDSTGAVRGESNGNAKITNEDVIFIRTCYKEKIFDTSVDLWETHYSYLNQKTIENIFFGRNWTHLMMEVYTNDLNNYYKEQYLKRAIGGRNKKGEENPNSIISEKDVVDMRALYQKKSRQEIFKYFTNYSERTIVSIISGQNWKHLPVYKKRKNKWEFPVDWSKQQIEDFKKYLQEFYLAA